jgi:hypothetical protein
MSGRGCPHSRKRLALREDGCALVHAGAAGLQMAMGADGAQVAAMQSVSVPSLLAGWLRLPQKPITALWLAGMVTVLVCIALVQLF